MCSEYPVSQTESTTSNFWYAQFRRRTRFTTFGTSRCTKTRPMRRGTSEGDHGPTRKMPLGHRSQSEADWAYAKRALARGDAAEEVIRKIADYRAEDKADPEYYARLTVTKAQAELHRHESTSNERAKARGSNPSSHAPGFEAPDRDRTRL